MRYFQPYFHNLEAAGGGGRSLVGSRAFTPPPPAGKGLRGDLRGGARALRPGSPRALCARLPARSSALRAAWCRRCRGHFRAPEELAESEMPRTCSPAAPRPSSRLLAFRPLLPPFCPLPPNTPSFISVLRMSMMTWKRFE